MDADRWFQPCAWVAFLTMGLVAGGLWILFALWTAYAVVWWPEHQALKNGVADWLRGMTILISILVASPLVLHWLWFRRVAWHVGPGGIAVYRRGKLRKSFDWSEIVTLNVLPFYAAVRSAAHPFGQEIPWLAGEDVLWLSEFASARLGQRLVGIRHTKQGTGP